MKASLTVFFEDPFWVGVFERIEDGKLSVCKVTFGAEPKDYEVWDYVLHHCYELVFSPAIETETRQTADNPKRRLRNARKHLENTGIGTSITWKPISDFIACAQLRICGGDFIEQYLL